MCDTQCHKDGVKFDDIASVMVEDDGEPRTKHLCKMCWQFDARREEGAEGKRPAMEMSSR